MDNIKIFICSITFSQKPHIALRFMLEYQTKLCKIIEEFFVKEGGQKKIKNMSKQLKKGSVYDKCSYYLS